MPTQTIAIAPSDMCQMTDEIWSGMLQIDLQPCERGSTRSHGIGACVLITGAWQGAVRVDCSLALARLATSKFLAVDVAEVEIEQIRDAMGELANMSAGSVKPLLPAPCQISLPSVADGSDYNLTVPQGEVVLVSEFQYRGEPLSVTIFRRRGLHGRENTGGSGGLPPAG